VSVLKSPKKRRIEIRRALCGADGPDDGLDPRIHGKPRRNAARARAARSDRKARQLGRQVAETLEAVFAGDSRDDLLHSLHVVSVTPAPDASRLPVTLAPLPSLGIGRIDAADLLDRLAKSAGRLRSEVAAAITRKHAPVLTYRLVLPPGTRT
jgi:ribosome-binding factor A